MKIFLPLSQDAGYASKLRGAEAVREGLARGLSLADALYQVMRVEIVTGIIPVGVRLRERDLSKEYGASRTPVREVLHRLGSEGFLTLTDAGLTVTEVSADDISDGWKIREQMLKIVAELAIERAPPEDLAALYDILGKIRAEVAREDRLHALKLTLAFEELLFRAAHSRTAMRIFSASIGPPGRMPLLLKDADRFAAATDERMKILDAIRDRNLPRAIEAVEAHARAGRANHYPADR